MADKVTFTMEAEVAQVVRANEQVVASEKKVEQQFTQTARSAEQSNRQIEQSTRRTATTVASSVQEYGLSPLGVAPPGGGSAVRFSSAGSSTRRPRAFSLAPVAVQSAAAQLVVERSTAEPFEVRNREERMQRAQVLRDNRAFAREVASIDARNTQVGGRNLAGMAWVLGSAQRGMARADERYNARIGADASSAINASTIAYAAGGGVFGQDDDLTGRARRRVAANVMRTPELRGKVNAEDFEVMTQTMARRMQEGEVIRGRIFTLAGLVGAAILGAATGIVRDMEASRRKLDEFAAGARGATSLPSFPGGFSTFKQFAGGLSNEYGADLNRTVTPLLEQIGRQSADLTPQGREQIARQSLRFEQLTGGPAGTFASVLDQIMDVDPSVGSTQAGNLVEFLRSRGGLDIQTQQQVLGTLLPTAKMAGIGTDEVAGLSAMLSGMGGPEGQLAKGGRGILNRLDVLKKGGYISGAGGLFGAFTELDRLRSRQPDAFDQAMGEVSSAAGPVLDAILTNRSTYEANVSAARAALGGGDVLGDQFRGRLGSDAEFKLAVQSGQARARIENAPLAASTLRQSQQVEFLNKRAERFERREADINSGDPGREIGAYVRQYSGWDYVAPLLYSTGLQDPRPMTDARPVSAPSQLNLSNRNFLVAEGGSGSSGVDGNSKRLEGAAAEVERAMGQFRAALGRQGGPKPRPAMPGGVTAPQ